MSWLGLGFGVQVDDASRVVRHEGKVLRLADDGGLRTMGDRCRFRLWLCSWLWFVVKVRVRVRVMVRLRFGGMVMVRFVVKVRVMVRLRFGVMVRVRVWGLG